MNDSTLESPDLGEGDDPPEDDNLIDVDLEPELKDYPWARRSSDADAVALRSFIFQTLADSNTSILPSVEHMEACFLWIWNGELPKPEGKKKPGHLKPVEPA